MSEAPEYKVVLCPAGETPSTALDVKRFTYETTSTDEDQVWEEVVDHIVTELIDRDIFYKYWEVWSVQPTTEGEDSTAPSTSFSEFKNRLPGGSSQPFQSLNPRRTLSLYIIKNGGWEVRALYPSAPKYNSYDIWMQKVWQKHSRIGNKNVEKRDLTEATVRTVVSENPSFASRFVKTNPNLHDKALDIVKNNESTFISELKSVCANRP